MNEQHEFFQMMGRMCFMASILDSLKRLTELMVIDHSPKLKMIRVSLHNAVEIMLESDLEEGHITQEQYDTLISTLEKTIV